MLGTNFFDRGNDVKGFFRGYGSFGEINGEVEREAQYVFQKTENYRIECRYEREEYGVISRRDSFINCSGKPLALHCLKSRFVFEGGEYEVYTQFNNWQTESLGAWQPLVTNVTVSGASARTCQDATPFLVLWSEQEQRGAAFHLIPNSAWEIKVTRAGHYCKYSKVVVELGILDYNFDMTLASDECILMPEILCYEVRNKVDMDCYKLHHYMHKYYPRREMPIIYNTWMYRFDRINYENLTRQIPLAAELGVEYFVIDAGWFGKGKVWSASVGDWSENLTGALCGKMIDIAKDVRAAGMKFGLWLEPERAMPESDSVRTHPEYYIAGDVESEFYFLDFANGEAREWMLGVIDNLIERYGLAYIKSDFNADMYFDVYHCAYLKYFEGYAKFISTIRERHPDLYLSCCAAGGQRMELGAYIKFDSIWPSDNENPYSGMRIYRDTIRRLPPQAIERWAAVHSLTGFESFYEAFGGKKERMVASGDANWNHIVGVHPSFMNGYMTCGPIGFSCDLALLTKEVREQFKEFVTKVKKERIFWKSAIVRILCDTPTVMTFQYSNASLSKIVIQLFTHETMQDGFLIYPFICEHKQYRINGNKIYAGKELAEDGILLETEFWHDNWHKMHEIILEAVE